MGRDAVLAAQERIDVGRVEGSGAWHAVMLVVPVCDVERRAGGVWTTRSRRALCTPEPRNEALWTQALWTDRCDNARDDCERCHNDPSPRRRAGEAGTQNGPAPAGGPGRRCVTVSRARRRGGRRR
ncbi:hypothetical protein GCM10009528_03080 [Kineococcus aurantiacus]